MAVRMSLASGVGSATLLLVSSLIGAAETRVNPRDGLTYVRIPAGSYLMGCGPSDKECYEWESKPMEVQIAKEFWIGQTEVTQKAYQAVMGRNPSRYPGVNRPVDQVSWKDAVEYCLAVGMRLPNETEWEYAARGGVSEPRYGAIASIAWFDGNGADQTHEVAQKAPNPFGLYDMLGNMWEWVQDSYGESSDKRVLCGGSFLQSRAGSEGVEPELGRAGDSASKYGVPVCGGFLRALRGNDARFR